MPSCEMCGNEDSLTLCEIEGVELNVCSDCAMHGKVIKRARVKLRKKHQKAVDETEVIETIVEDIGKLVKDKREDMGLKQIELAKRLKERESVIQKIESGGYTPSIEFAYKLEKFLGLSLVVKKEVKKTLLKAKKTTLTIGDMIKIK